MPDRRRDKRFKLVERPEGTLKCFLDVIVQPHGKDEWLALTREPAQTGETLVLDVVVDESDGGELRERAPVCVTDSRAVILDGDLRYRLRLMGGLPAPVRFEQARAQLMSQQTGDSPGILTRELYIRVVDVSASGCLIESRRRFGVGTVARLTLKLGNTEFAEDVAVVRCLSAEGAPSVHHIGVRFLWTSPRHQRSIRHAVARHAAEFEKSDPARVM